MQELFTLFIIFILYILIPVGIIVTIIKAISKSSHRSVSSEDAAQLKPTEVIPSMYHYKRRDLIMTRAENDFFRMLDDWSHKLNKRQARDAEVERIFKGANFPLLRFGHRGPYTPQSIAESINTTGILQTNNS